MQQFTLEELRQYDGTNGKIYIAVMGCVYDVSAKAAMYGKGASYGIFAGRDASRGLANQADVINTDISSLTPEERSTLDNWVSFYRQRYQQVGVLRQ